MANNPRTIPLLAPLPSVTDAMVLPTRPAGDTADKKVTALQLKEYMVGNLTLTNLDDVAISEPIVDFAPAGGAYSAREITASVLFKKRMRELTQVVPVVANAALIDFVNGSRIFLDYTVATGSVTLTFNNPVVGQMFLHITHGGTQRNTILPVGSIQSGGGANTINPGASASNRLQLLELTYDGTKYIARTANYW